MGDALDVQIGRWRAAVERQPGLTRVDVETREGSLRGHLAALADAGLTADEAFLVAVRRMGRLDGPSRQFARAHAEQLLVGAANDDTPGADRAHTLGVLSLAMAAALAVKVPALFGVRPATHAEFYVRNGSLFVLPLLTAYFAWRRRAALAGRWGLGVPFVVAVGVVNGFPFAPGGDTAILAGLHLPIALWLVVGVAYTAGHWRDGSGRMDFVRFSGELAINYVLIALGGVVFTAFSMMMFAAIDVRADWLAEGWIIPCGAAGAVIVGAWLVDSRPRVMQHMAPVLTWLFTPLFTLLLLAFLGTMAWTGHPIDVARPVLISFDVLLVLVVGLVLYAVSARHAQARPTLFDGLQLALVVCALAVDLTALAAMAARISEFGVTPNRVAALGENLILLANLAGSAWLYGHFLRGSGTFEALERWQVAYLPVYASWAAAVVLVFPPLFGFR